MMQKKIGNKMKLLKKDLQFQVLHLLMSRIKAKIKEPVL